MERPLFGWGAATFPILFNSKYTEFTRAYSSCNLILEMSYSYGTIFAFIITLSILIIIFKSFKIIFFNKNDSRMRLIIKIKN